MGIALWFCLSIFYVVGGIASSSERQDFGECQQTTQNQFLTNTCSSHYSDTAAQIIQSLYSTVATSDCELANPCDYPIDYTLTNEEEFDFIIVGAGSAGTTIANRLTKDSTWRVLVVESGGNPPKTSEVPSLFPLLRNTNVDWQYKTEADSKYCLGMKDGKCLWPRGKVLGGSSTINSMVYVRGNKKNYDDWANEGNYGWAYEDVLHYFKKSEDMRVEKVKATTDFDRYHGKGGNLKVETFPNSKWKPLVAAFGEGMSELGYSENPDYNGKNQSGFVQFQATLEDGRRCSAAKAFLKPAVRRHNLKVSQHSHVSKLLIDKSSNTAYGIELITNTGNCIVVYATKEVVLSAGAINSPQLLMLSGIGPREHLEKLNINTLIDLPVGENLQDHPLMNGLVLSFNYSLPSSSPLKDMFQFLLKEESDISGLGLSSVGGFISTGKDVNLPEIQFFLPDFEKNSTIALSGFLSSFNYKQDIIDKYLEINSNSFVAVVLGSLIRPNSKGTLLLKSLNPKDPLEIIPGYLTDIRDINIYLNFYEFMLKLVNTKGFKSVGAKLIEINVPGCNSFKFASKEYRKCSLRFLTSTTFHPVGTCKMGPINSPNSVVDPELRVKGIENLRVIDASIMPTIVGGNTNAAVIMIAEKGADLIKQTWGDLNNYYRN